MSCKKQKSEKQYNNKSMSELHWTRKSCASASGTNWNKVLGGEYHEQSTNRKKWTSMCIMSLLERSYWQYHNTSIGRRKCFHIWEYRKTLLLQKRYRNRNRCDKRMPVFQAKVWRLKKSESPHSLKAIYIFSECKESL